MLSFLGRNVSLCDGITRREALRVGGLAFTGLAWSDLFRNRATAAPKGTFGKAKACIIVFNYGGPSHLDLWDLKPDAPAEVRGEFKPVATNVSGVSICEHLPRLAKLRSEERRVGKGCRCRRSPDDHNVLCASTL